MRVKKGKHRSDKKFRGRLKIKQEEIAAFLSVKRSLVNMHERNERHLPSCASLKLTRLEEKFFGISAKKNITIPTDVESLLSQRTNSQKQQEKYKKEYLKRKINNLKADLDEMKLFYKDLLAWINVIDQEMIANPSGSDQEKDNLWLTIQRNNAIKKLLKCDYAAQEALELEILKSEAEEKFYRKKAGDRPLFKSSDLLKHSGN